MVNETTIDPNYTPDGEDKEQRATRKARLYEAIRKQIEHEDGLINQRFTWALNSSGFLFAGYFLLFTNIDKFSGDLLKSLQAPLVIICGIGILTCVIYRFAIRRAEESLTSLRSFWYTTFPEENITSEYPSIHHFSEKKILIVDASTKGVLDILALSWVFLLIASFYISKNSISKSNLETERPNVINNHIQLTSKDSIKSGGRTPRYQAGSIRVVKI